MNKFSNHGLLLISCVCFYTCFFLPGHAEDLRLFNSGTDANRSVLPLGSIDPHITIIDRNDGSNSSLAYVVSNNVWISNTTVSAWISASPDPRQAVNHQWTFRVPLDLTTYDLNTVSIQARVSSDNQILWTRLNSQDIGFTTPYEAFYGWTQLTLTNGFVEGTNSLDFRLNDGGLISGFRIELTGSATRISTNNPEAVIRCSETGISWLSSINTTYRVEYCTNLNAPAWTLLPGANCVSGNGAYIEVYDKIFPGNAYRFYRIEIPGTNCAGPW